MKSFSASLVHYIMAISLCLLSAASTTAQLIPIALSSSSFNADVIAEGVGSNPAAVTSTAIGSQVLFDMSFRAANPVITAGGLPANGTIINGTNSWQLNSYSQNNVLFFAPQIAPSSSSLSLPVPMQYSVISLLTTAAGASVPVDIILHFSDESSTPFGPFIVNLAIGGSPFVIRGFGLIDRQVPGDQTGAPDEPRLYQLDIPLSAPDQSKMLESIEIVNNDVNEFASLLVFAASGTPIVALPITFSSLSAQYQSSEKKIVLSWEAQTGLNSSGFEVERSDNGSAFTTIATVNSNKIMGTSNYSYTDNNLLNRPAWFYRIKETIAGGTINYSKIINVKTSAAISIKVIQSAGFIRLSTTLPDKSFTYKIVDLNGKQLKSGTITSADQFAIDIHSLPYGAYVLNIFNQTQTRSIKFVK